MPWRPCHPETFTLSSSSTLCLWNSIFELADLWTRSIDASEYCDFLRTLLARVTTLEDSGAGEVWRAETNLSVVDV